MKKLFLLGLLACAFAGNPEQADAKSSNVLNFQGTIKDAQDQVVDKNMSMTFKIYNTPTGGAALWTESNVVAVKQGFFNVYLGQTQDLDINFADELYLEITLDNGDVLPRTRVSASPFSFRSGVASFADTADVAKSVIDGVIKWENFTDQARIAGGALSGTYPNPELNYTQLVDGLPKFGIPGDKIAPGSYLHIQTSPAGPALGDVEGSSFPNLYLHDDVIDTKHLKKGAVTVDNIGGTTPADSNKVLVVGTDGIPKWGPVPSPLEKLGYGTTDGQMFYWDTASNSWKLSHNIAPTDGQVLKYDAVTGLYRWMDDDGFKIPYINDDANTNSDDAIRIAKTDGNPGNILDLANNTSIGQEVVKLTAVGDRAFADGVLNVDATSNANLNGPSKGIRVNQTVLQDSNLPSSAIDATNTATANHNSIHSGVNATSNLTGANGTAIGVNGTANGGDASIGVKGQATGGANFNIGVFADKDGAVADTVNAALYAGSTTDNAIYAKGNPADANYVAQVKEADGADGGRGLYAEGASVNNIGITDAGDVDNAVVVVRNASTEAAPAWATTIGAEGKTAIKTYGDIWANGGVGGNVLVAKNSAIIGDPAGEHTTITPPAAAGDPLTFSTGIQAPSMATQDLTVGTPTDPGQATINGDLTVTGLTNFNNMHLSGNLAVDGNTTLGTDAADILTVNATTSFMAPMTATDITANNITANTSLKSNGTLSATGNTTLGANLSVAGNETVGGTLGVTGATTLGNTLTVAGATTLNGATTINNTLHTTGNTTLDANLTVGGNETVGGTLGVTGATTLGNTLTVAGATTLNGATTINNTLGVTGNTTLGADLSVAGDETIAGNSSIGGDQTVAGNSDITGDQSVGGTLDVTGATTLNNTLDVTGNTTLGADLAVAGNSAIAGNETIGGTLDVTGATTLDNTLTVAGATQLNNTLTVADGMATVLGGTLQVKEDATFDMNADITENLTVDGNTTLGDDIATDQVTVNAKMNINGALQVTAPATFTQPVTFQNGGTVTGGNLAPTTSGNIAASLITLNPINTQTPDPIFTVDPAINNTSHLDLYEIAKPWGTSFTDAAVQNISVDGTFMVWDEVGQKWVYDQVKNYDEVDMTNVNAVPRWDGTHLVDGQMSDDGTNIVTIGVDPASGTPKAANLVVDNTTGAEVITANGNFAVTGNETVAGDLGVTGVTTLDGDLLSNANTTLGDDATDAITVNGKTTFQPTAEVEMKSDLVTIGEDNTDQLIVNSTVTFNSAISFTDLTVTGTLDAQGDVNLGSDAADIITVNGTSNFIAPATFTDLTADNITATTTLVSNGTLEVTGTSTLNDDLTVNGDTQLNGELNTTGATQLGSTLNVIGATTLQETLTVADTKATILGGTLTVKEKAFLQDDLQVDGASNVNGNSNVGGALTVTGATTLNSTLDVAGATGLASTLDVTGATTLASTLDVTGATTLASTLDVTGATALASTLDVAGATALASTLDVTGATTLNSTLDVTDATRRNW